MTLAELVQTGEGRVDVKVCGVGDVAVSGLSLDSRQVRAGDLFFALPGSQTEGWCFIAEAVERGAVAVVTHPLGKQAAVAASVPTVLTDAPGRLMALMASRFFDDPSRSLVLVGVTGTNGKTTVSFLLESVLRRAGHATGVIGTISYRGGAGERVALLTTPPAPELQEQLALMRNAGVTHVVMEVSSHSLSLDRVGGCHWDAAVFTNLGRDHLDFHRDLESYFMAKAKLVTEGLASSGKGARFAVINIDDPWGRRLSELWSGRQITFGLRNVGRAREHVSASGVRMSLDGIEGQLTIDGGEVSFHSHLVGAGHLANITTCAATAWGLGIARETIVAGISDLRSVPGRLERIDEGQPFGLFVDYAHTPDALGNVLSSLRAFARRLVVVFGCGGDRDRGKRPLMGQVVAELGDVIFLTSDNPRTEDPMGIIAEVEVGLRAGGAVSQGSGGSEAARPGKVIDSQPRHIYQTLPDRREAIAAAIDTARAGDVVLIAGKGHEDYQILGRAKVPFDDRKAAREALGSIGNSR